MCVISRASENHFFPGLTLEIDKRISFMKMMITFNIIGLSLTLLLRNSEDAASYALIRAHLNKPQLNTMEKSFNSKDLDYYHSRIFNLYLQLLFIFMVINHR